MNVTELKGEKSLEILADFIDPISEIATDKKFRSLLESDKKLEAVKYLLKSHPKEVLYCMALYNCEDPETYQPNFFALPKILLDFFNSPMVADLFTSGDTVTSSGSPTENTEGEEK